MLQKHILTLFPLRLSSNAFGDFPCLHKIDCSFVKGQDRNKQIKKALAAFAETMKKEQIFATKKHKEGAEVMMTSLKRKGNSHVNRRIDGNKFGDNDTYAIETPGGTENDFTSSSLKDSFFGGQQRRQREKKGSKFFDPKCEDADGVDNKLTPHIPRQLSSSFLSQSSGQRVKWIDGDFGGEDGGDVTNEGKNDSVNPCFRNRYPSKSSRNSIKKKTKSNMIEVTDHSSMKASNLTNVKGQKSQRSKRDSSLSNTKKLSSIASGHPSRSDFKSKRMKNKTWDRSTTKTRKKNNIPSISCDPEDKLNELSFLSKDSNEKIKGRKKTTVARRGSTCLESNQENIHASLSKQKSHRTDREASTVREPEVFAEEKKARIKMVHRTSTGKGKQHKSNISHDNPSIDQARKTKSGCGSKKNCGIEEGCMESRNPSSSDIKDGVSSRIKRTRRKRDKVSKKSSNIQECAKDRALRKQPRKKKAKTNDDKCFKLLQPVDCKESKNKAREIPKSGNFDSSCMKALSEESVKKTSKLSETFKQAVVKMSRRNTRKKSEYSTQKRLSVQGFSKQDRGNGSNLSSGGHSDNKSRQGKENKVQKPLDASTHSSTRENRAMKKRKIKGDKLSISSLKNSVNTRRRKKRNTGLLQRSTKTNIRDDSCDFNF